MFWNFLFSTQKKQMECRLMFVLKFRDLKLKKNETRIRVVKKWDS
jgi:hypothetical protein